MFFNPLLTMFVLLNFFFLDPLSVGVVFGARNISLAPHFQALRSNMKWLVVTTSISQSAIIYVCASQFVFLIPEVLGGRNYLLSSFQKKCEMDFYTLNFLLIVLIHLLQGYKFSCFDNI